MNEEENKKSEEQIDAMVSEAATQMTQTAADIPEKKSIDMSGLKETLINYIVPLIALVLTLIIGLFVLMPSYKSLPQLKTEVESKKLLRTNLSAKVNTLEKLIDFSSVVDENSNLVSKVLVSEQLVPGLLTQVDKIVSESGLTINRLNYGVGVTTDSGATGEVTYNIVTVNLGVNGSFEQLKSFLRNLENAARIINVDKIRYSLAESDAGNYLGVNFVLVSPYLFVESSAVTDERIDLDIADPTFVDLINKLKGLKYYDPTDVDFDIKVVESTEEDDAIFDEDAEVSAETLTEEEVEAVLEGN